MVRSQFLFVEKDPLLTTLTKIISHHFLYFRVLEFTVLFVHALFNEPLIELLIFFQASEYLFILAFRVYIWLSPILFMQISVDHVEIVVCNSLDHMI